MNEILFYGGLVLAVAAALVLLVTVLVLRIRSVRLEAALTAEYGPRQKKAARSPSASVQQE